MLQYRCNSCNRTIHLPENRSGLHHFGRCVITRNCRGSLFQIATMPNILRVPDPISKNDWYSSPQLFNYTHTIPQRIWRFKHNLNCIPTINVFIGDPLEQTFDFSSDIDGEYCTLTFGQNIIGEVQCVARTPTESVIQKDISPEYTKISLNTQLTIAVHLHNDMLSVSPFYNNALKIPLNDQEIGFDFVSKNGANSWFGTEQIQMHGLIFDLYSYKLDTNPDIKNNYGTFRYKDDLQAGYFLLSKGSDPYDKVYHRVVDITKLDSFNNYIRNNELFVHSDIIDYCNPNIIPLS